MKTIAILIVLAIIVVCSGFYFFTKEYDFDNSYSKSSINASLLSSERVENQNKSISMLVPKNASSSISNGQINVSFVKQLDEEIAPFILSIERNNSKSYDLYSDDGLKEFTKSLESSLNALGFDILSISKASGIGEQAVIVEASYINNGIKVRTYNLYAQTDGGLRGLVASVEFDKWDKYQEVMLSALLSSEIK